MSPLTGESQSVARSARRSRAAPSVLEADDLVFCGCLCTAGEAEAVVYATGMATQLGRIAALSQRVRTELSPLQLQVNRAAKLIAADRRCGGPALPGHRHARRRAAARRRDHVRDRPARGERARGPAADDHSRARGRRAADGAPARAAQAPDRGRDARLDRRHLHRQDGDAHRGPHVGPQALGRRRPSWTRPPSWAAGSASPSRPSRGPRSAATTRTRISRPTAGSAAGTRARALSCSPPPRSARTSMRPRPSASTRRRRLFHFDPRLKRMTTLDAEPDGSALVPRQGRAPGAAASAAAGSGASPASGRSTTTRGRRCARPSRAMPGPASACSASRNGASRCRPTPWSVTRQSRGWSSSAWRRFRTRPGPTWPTRSQGAAGRASGSS